MSKYYLAVDVGGTKILTGLLNEAGEVLQRSKSRTDRGSRKRLVEQIGTSLEEMIARVEVPREEIQGIALGVPGVVEGASGQVVFTPNAPLSDTPLAALLRERIPLPIFIANDVNLGVLGEFRYGAARGTSSAFGIFVGTGIGGGLILDGKLVEGFRGLGGEIGHLMIPLGADEIAGMLTRKHLFLEDLCSRTAIENQLRHAILREKKSSVLPSIVGDKKLERIRSSALREALARKDALVIDVLKRASFLLGLATASILHVVDPEVIVFGGGVIEACGTWMLPLIEKTARKVAMPGTGRKVRVERSALGDDAILLGGLALLRQRLAEGLPAEPHVLQTARVTATAATPLTTAQVDKPLAGG